MNKNVGNTERAIRIGGGLILVVLAASGTVGLWGLPRPATHDHRRDRLVPTLRHARDQYLRKQRLTLLRITPDTVSRGLRGFVFVFL